MHSNSLLNSPILTIQVRRALLGKSSFVVFDGSVKKQSTPIALDEELLASQEFQRQTMAAKLNWLRAGVLGANDGIVSTAGLVMGVAGATTDSNAILIAGIAVLAFFLVGGFSSIGYVVTPVSVLAITAIYALEVLVAFIQAYVFTILTCVYLKDALHPGH